MPLCGQKFTRGDLGDPENRDQTRGRERDLSLQGRKGKQLESAITSVSYALCTHTLPDYSRESCD